LRRQPQFLDELPLAAIMKPLPITLLFILLSSTCYGQSINIIKTDADCEKFIRANIDDHEDFYFDTIFPPDEAKNLRPQFKSWELFDLNEDGQLDLFFIGKFKKYKASGITANLYFSSKNSYELLPLKIRYIDWYRPHIFLRKVKRKVLMIVQQYKYNKFIKIQDWLKIKPTDKEFLKGDDTLVYKNDAIINFTSNPSKIIFDSLTLTMRNAWFYQNDSFVVFKSGVYKYFNLLDPSLNSFSGPHNRISNFETLKRLIGEIDLQQTRTTFVNGIDSPYSELTIYKEGKKISFFDQSLGSSFTLRAIYTYFKQTKL
jgi:hypothetical protein